MEFIETSVFFQTFKTLSTEEDLRELQIHLLQCPLGGELIQGTGGIRKIRWNSRGKGKRGGLRILYIPFLKRNKIYLLDVFLKGEKIDLTPSDKKALKGLVQIIKNEEKNG